jgi:hypothetical protein
MFDLIAPDPATINPLDIANALSNICRFTGHVREFYSVAQHCLLVAHLLPRELKFMGLMHDAHEAYVNDLSTPHKGLCEGYRATEALAWEAVAERFALPVELPAAVKYADLVALGMEKRDLLKDHPEEWPCLVGVKLRPEPVIPYSHSDARYLWLDMFQSLGGIIP